MPTIIHLDAGIGWKRLARTLQNLQKVVNKNCPVKGHGISIHETESGSIIAIDPQSDGGGGTNALGAAITGWLTFTWNGVGWQDLTVVDPATCAQSTIKVLTKLDGTGVTVPFYLDPSTIAPTSGTDTSTFVIYVMTGNPLQATTPPPR